MDLLLGLDVGTTATKALMFDLEGSVVASAQYNYGLITPREGWVEQDPEELWRGVVETSRAVAGQLRAGDRIVALSQSSQAGTTIPIGVDGRPLHNAISWMDQRAAHQADEVREKFGAEFIQTTTGWPLIGALPLQHIRWLGENDPDTFAATQHFAFVNDFIIERLTGQWCMNRSDAGITELMNVTTGDWDERLLELAGISRDQVSPLQPSGCAVGTLTAAASEATGLSQDVLVVSGAHDQYCAAVGTGVTKPGQVLLSCGTAWVVLAIPASVEEGLGSGMAVSCHAVEGRWGAIRSLGGVGTSMEWLLDNVWGNGTKEADRESLYNGVNEGVARSSAGSQGLLFFPLAGGHLGDYGPGKGGFVGLSLVHTRDDMARAVMEGTAAELRWLLDEVRESGLEVTDFKMVGGAAQSPEWPRIVADATGVRVTLPTIKQAASAGAAILAGVGACRFPDPEAGFLAFGGDETTLEPDEGAAQLYNEWFDSYKAMHGLVLGG